MIRLFAALFVTLFMVFSVYAADTAQVSTPVLKETSPITAFVFAI